MLAEWEVAVGLGLVSLKLGICNMARIEGLMQEIETFFDGRLRAISTVYLIKRYFLVPALIAGMIFGAAAHDVIAFLLAGAIAGGATYFWAENYLMNIDKEFFSSPNRSRREIFNRYYADEAARRLALRMTEPWVIVSDGGKTDSQRQSEFKEQLATELEDEFKRSDWRFFVAESIHYQRRNP